MNAGLTAVSLRRFGPEKNVRSPDQGEVIIRCANLALFDTDYLAVYGNLPAGRIISRFQIAVLFNEKTTFSSLAGFRAMLSVQGVRENLQPGACGQINCVDNHASPDYGLLPG